MKPYVQSPSIPCQVPIAFDEAIVGMVTGMRWAVAYVSKSGVELMELQLKNALGDKWQWIEKTIVTSCDYGITQPEAVEILREWPKCEVFLSSPAVLSRPRLLPRAAFHPKVFIFDKADGQAIISGSANLTERAMTINTEVVVLTTGPAANSSWERIWKASVTGAVKFSPSLVAEYRRVRRRVRVPDVLDPPPPSVGPIVRRALPAFWGEIEARRLNPRKYETFWIEAGSMSSSGSHHQLELPRGANRFFGFRFAEYALPQKDIGKPILIANGTRFRDRKLAWHGDNDMERVYLPTRAKSGLTYQDRLVLFRRRKDGFSLHVFPWESSLAASCRGASKQLGRLFRVPSRLRKNQQPRICGVF